MKNKKTIILSITAIIVMIIALVGVTYAFFSYYRTGSENVIKTGDIYFSSDYTSVTLENVFPIDKATIETDTQNVLTVRVHIEGHTSYEEGIDYFVKASDVNITVNNKNVPLSVNVTSEDIPNVYLTSYEDEMMVVDNSVFAQGNIKPEDGNVDGYIILRAYIDKNQIAITDTPVAELDEWINGRTVLTTEEWNNLQANPLSFKVTIMAWEHEETLYDVMQASAVMDNVASDFVTSATGIDFSQTSSDTNGKGLYKLSSTENDQYPIVYYRGAVEDNNVLFGGFCWKAVRTTDTGGVKLIYNGEPSEVYEKAELVQEQYTILTSTDNFEFDNKDNSWNLISSNSNVELSFNVPKGNNYVMEITGTAIENSSVGYTVFKDDVSFYGGGGTSIKYNASYGDLTSENVVKLLLMGSPGATFKIKMTYSGNLIGYGCEDSSDNSYIMSMDIFDENSYGYMYSDIFSVQNNINNIESNAKEKIENWYVNNLIDYANKLEDTIWCNDRSIVDNQNSFLTTYNRVHNTKIPILNCANINDKFSVSNQKAKTNYPIGLITSDEIMLAGGSDNVENVLYYLYTGRHFWTMSPANYSTDYEIFVVNNNGTLGEKRISHISDFRPMISLAYGATIEDGDGTAANPYVINGK